MKPLKYMSLISLLFIAYISAAVAKSIVIKTVQSEVTVNLPTNPTTGYMWFVVRYNAKLITPVGHNYEPANGNKVGQGGIDVWTFNLTPTALKAPHIIKIEMLYARPWSLHDEPKSQTIIIATTPN